MFSSTAEVADTLRLLIPGFVFMKILYQWGLRTKRSDTEWAAWSLLAAAVLQGIADLALNGAPNTPLWFTFLLAVALGLLAAVIWQRCVSIWPSLRGQVGVNAWSVVLAEPRWIQVQTTGGQTFTGYVRHAADAVETDSLDIYLAEPVQVVGEERFDLGSSVEGLLISREQIELIAVLRPKAA